MGNKKDYLYSKLYLSIYQSGGGQSRKKWGTSIILSAIKIIIINKNGDLCKKIK